MDRIPSFLLSNIFALVEVVMNGGKALFTVTIDGGTPIGIDPGFGPHGNAWDTLRDRINVAAGNRISYVVYNMPGHVNSAELVSFDSKGVRVRDTATNSEFWLPHGRIVSLEIALGEWDTDETTQDVEHFLSNPPAPTSRAAGTSGTVMVGGRKDVKTFSNFLR